MASSFLKNNNIMKLLAFLFLAISYISFTTAAPTDSAAVDSRAVDSPAVDSPLIKRADDLSTIPNAQNYSAYLLGEITNVLTPRQRRSNSASVAAVSDLSVRGGAGLLWGPVYIGNLKLSLTNPHVGPAGPKFPNANHVNFHVDKQAPRNTYVAVVNMHIVKYTRGGTFCLYIWESETKKVVFDKCFDSFLPAISEAVSAIKNFVDELLKNANFWASFAIIAILVVVIADCLAGLAVVAL